MCPLVTFATSLVSSSRHAVGTSTSTSALLHLTSPLSLLLVRDASVTFALSSEASLPTNSSFCPSETNRLVILVRKYLSAARFLTRNTISFAVTSEFSTNLTVPKFCSMLSTSILGPTTFLIFPSLAIFCSEVAPKSISYRNSSALVCLGYLCGAEKRGEQSTDMDVGVSSPFGFG